MFKTLDRYCYLEFMVMLMVGTTLPAGLLFFTDKIKELQQYISKFGCPFDLYVLMTTMQVPDIIVHCLPAGVLIATVLVLHRMMSDTEIIGLQTGGVSQARILQPFLVIALSVGVFSFLVNEFVVPRSLRMSSKLALLASSRVDLPDSGGGSSFTGKKGDGKGGVSELFLIPERKGNKLINACIFKFADEGIKLVYAPSGVFKGAAWYLFNGHEYNLSGGDKSSYLNKNFQKMQINPPDYSKLNPDNRELLPHEMNTSELVAKMIELKKLGKKISQEYYFNLNYNFAAPMSCVFLVIAAFPIALVGRRRRKTAISLVYSGFLLVFYFGLEQVFWAVAKFGLMDTTLAVWTPGLIIASMGAFLIWWNTNR